MIYYRISLYVYKYFLKLIEFNKLHKIINILLCIAYCIMFNVIL